MEDNENYQQGKLRVWSTASLYVDKILFPKIDLYQQYQKQADFGDANLDIAMTYSDVFRDINRYNGLKGMAEILFNLLINISSTVRIKGKKEEVEELKILISSVEKIKKIFYENRDMFFIKTFKDLQMVELLDRDNFQKVKNALDKIYVNTEILMTKNKLLFQEDENDFMTDKEIMDRIKEEYIEN